MTETYTQLTLMTLEELTQHETIIRNGLKQFEAVGTSLAKIRDEEGWRQRGAKSFEAYCLKEFGFGDRHGRRMIAAAQTATEVFKAIGQAPANESVARELKAVANDPIVLQKVKDKLEKKKTDIGHASAEVVADAVASATGKKKTAPRDDDPSDWATGVKPRTPAAKPTSQPEGAQPTGAPSRDDQVVEHLKRARIYLGQNNVTEAKSEIDDCLRLYGGELPGKAIVKPKVCKTCSRTVPNGAQICPNCGEVVK